MRSSAGSQDRVLRTSSQDQLSEPGSQDQLSGPALRTGFSGPALRTGFLGPALRTSSQDQARSGGTVQDVCCSTLTDLYKSASFLLVTETFWDRCCSRFCTHHILWPDQECSLGLHCHYQRSTSLCDIVMIVIFFGCCFRKWWLCVVTLTMLCPKRGQRHFKFS